MVAPVLQLSYRVNNMDLSCYMHASCIHVVYSVVCETVQVIPTAKAHERVGRM